MTTEKHDEDTAYGVAVVAKQCGLDQEAAAKKFSSLSADKKKALVEAGRSGNLPKCHEILKLEPEA